MDKYGYYYDGLACPADGMGREDQFWQINWSHAFFFGSLHNFLPLLSEG